MTTVQINDATHPVSPVKPRPPHWPYSATVPAAADDWAGGAALVLDGSGAALLCKSGEIQSAQTPRQREGLPIPEEQESRQRKNRREEVLG